MRFTDRVAIVTGGASGMGRAAVLGFAAEGAAVVVNDIDEAGLQATAGAVRALGGRVALAPGDVTAAATIDLMVERAATEFGRIDILFTYVGGDPDLAPQRPFMDQTEDFWERMIAVNLTSTIRACRAVLPAMIAQGRGRIVTPAPSPARSAAPTWPSTRRSKAASSRSPRPWRSRRPLTGSPANCVCPGPIATPGLQRVFSDQNAREITGIVPLGRLGTPEEVASAVLYLASDEASFITGQALSVDGGATRDLTRGRRAEWTG